MRCFIGLTLCVGVLVGLPTIAQAGPLQDIEDAGRDDRTRREAEPGRRDTSERRSSGDEESEEVSEHDGDDEGLSAFWSYVFLLPWKLPHLLVDQPCASRYAAHPYRAGRGNLRNDALRPGCRAPDAASQASRAVAAQIALEGGYTLAFGSITSATLAARLQLPYRLELSGRLSVLTDLDERPREQALMGTTHLSVRFAQAAHVELRTGLGLRAYGLGEPLLGPDFLYAIDMYDDRPIVGSLELHGGVLGHAGVVQARLTIGYLLKNLELYVGYDHTRVRGSSGVTRLTGPLLGLRAWF